MVFSGPRRASGRVARFTVVTVCCLLLFYIRHMSVSDSFVSRYPFPIPNLPTKTTSEPDSPSEVPSPPEHPIDTLITAAEKTFNKLLGKETHNVKLAAIEYRKRRGRHPPPGFDTWFRFAQERGALIVEDFFDQIYHDLGPFWGLDPAVIRKEAWDGNMVVSVRNGEATTTSDWPWTEVWADMISSVAEYLPDMDIPVNPMDESRIMVPWEEIKKYMDKEKSTRKMTDPEQVMSEFQTLLPTGQNDIDTPARSRDWEQSYPFWDIASRGCHPDSFGRTADHEIHFNHNAIISPAYTSEYTYKGYISNYTLSTDYCVQPDLQSLHGTMMEPLTVSSTKILTPMFGGSKLLYNNEILLPPAVHWDKVERFLGSDGLRIPWNQKYDHVMWRGVASGGRNKEDNWKGFQRHRLVSMTNSTEIHLAETGTLPLNWALPSSQYNIASLNEGHFSSWVQEWSDTGFIELMCFPSQEGDLTCPYTSPHFSVVEPIEMAEQFKYKYLPDVDGNSFSGRFRGFLLSESVPIKATIYREWHDSRLVPWKHFVPMDNRFLDFYGIMEYFLGYEHEEADSLEGQGESKKKVKVVDGHDDQARKIALEGQKWANRVLRQEDMQVYLLRLLLEYARLSDKRRGRMGWVEDLLHPKPAWAEEVYEVVAGM